MVLILHTCQFQTRLRMAVSPVYGTALFVSTQSSLPSLPPRLLETISGFQRLSLFSVLS